MILGTNGKSIKRPTGKPVSIKICGTALVQMLDMVCQRVQQLLLKNEKSSTFKKRQMIIDDDPYSRTLSITDYARKSILFWVKVNIVLFLEFNNTLVGDCCLQACTLKTLLKYC
jgi:hypothetical protein